MHTIHNYVILITCLYTRIEVAIHQSSTLRKANEMAIHTSLVLRVDREELFFSSRPGCEK